MLRHLVAAFVVIAGIPATVVAQDTGFSNVLPTGEGLFAFNTMDEALAAIDAINGDYRRHCLAARRIAEEYFSAERVAGRLLAEAGLA